MGDFLDNQLLIAERIQNLCSTKKITINRMLADCGAGTRLVQNLKSGSFPSVDKFIKIADYFGCSVDFLLGRSDVSGFSQEEINLILAYRCAEPDDKTIVNTALRKYAHSEQEKAASAG